LAADVEQYFVPVRGAAPAGASLEYRPLILGVGQARIVDTKRGVEAIQAVVALTPPAEGPVALSWDQAAVVSLDPAELEAHPRDQSRFAPLPSAGSEARSYAGWRRDLADWLYRTQTVELLVSPDLDLTSTPGESEGDFRVRLAQAGREKRDLLKEQLQQRYAPKLATIDERIQKAQHAVEREAEQARGAQMQTAISFGATLLGAFLGRKKLSTGTLGRATTAARGVGRSADEAADVGRAQENVQSLVQKRAELEEAFAADVEALEAKLDPSATALEPVVVRPRKSDVTVQLVALAWQPYWIDAQGQATAATG